MGPLEGGHSAFTGAEAHGLLASNLVNIAGALCTGPLYGWLVEPLALHVVRRALPGEPSAVVIGEVTSGVALGTYFVLQHRRFRDSRRHSRPPAAPAG